MVRSWWALGEGSGVPGKDLNVNRITCPFCLEKGNFAIVFSESKKKPNNSKQLNFTTLKCGNCAGFVMVLWSAGEKSNYHDCEVLPYPIQNEGWPDYWPANVGRYWLQAQKSLASENWDAAVIMARSALQIALRIKGAEGRSLKDEIANFSTNGDFPKVLAEWAHEVRELGNDSAHPAPEQVAIEPKDARDIVEFLDFTLDFLFTLPEKVKQYRARRET